MSREEKRQEAMELVGKAYQHHMKGEIEKAIELYNQSLASCPTAEAYTFRGWARSYQPEPDFAEAIADCHRPSTWTLSSAIPTTTSEPTTSS